MFSYTNRKLGEILVTAGALSEDELKKALEEQKVSKKRLGEILIENKHLTQQQLIDSLVVQLGIPYIDLDYEQIPSEIIKLIPETIAVVNAIVPVKKDNNTLTLAVADPLDYGIINDMGIYTGLKIEPVIAEKEKILEKLRSVYAVQKAYEVAKELVRDNEPFKKPVGNIQTEVSDQPVIRLVNMMIEQAVLMNASDIHIEPEDNKMRIRFRIDGRLVVYMETGGDIISSVVSRIKFIGNMNIAEKRIPQDGRITYNHNGRKMDMRISVMPTVYGEKVVIRLLSTAGLDFTKEQLGFLPENLSVFNKILSQQNGIILVTGPTGSGKTTTLYTALKDKRRTDVNIITVEDPVEAFIPGITQVQVNPKAGLTFASALRSVLRQDPDSVMIGEIRDEETAQIAVRVAITGHLVFSTMHTNDAPSAVIRLIDMGIEPFLVSASVIGVISQRLVRKICPRCKKSYTPNEQDLRFLELDENSAVTLYKGDGCDFCNRTGYKGRTAIHEVMPVTAEIRKAINEKRNMDELRELAASQGMISLQDNAKKLVLNGTTALHEYVEMFYGEV